MKFLYGFGFETPSQRALNSAGGYDDEDSGALIIEAETTEAALEWGRGVAEAFLKWLYADPSISWAAGQYADWIEPEPMPSFTPEQLRSLPTVQLGELPPFSDLSVHTRPQPPPDQQSPE